MQERYPKTYLSILGNSGVQIFMSPHDPETAKFISQQSGVRDVVTHSRSVNYARDGWPVVTDSKGQGQRAVVLMQEAQTLPVNEALIWVRGIPGIIRCVHKRYFKQARFFLKYQRNPLYRR